MHDVFFCLRFVACSSQLTGPLIWLSFTGTVHRPKFMDITATVDLKGGFSGSLDFLNITNRPGIFVVTLTGAQMSCSWRWLSAKFGYFFHAALVVCLYKVE